MIAKTGGAKQMMNQQSKNIVINLQGKTQYDINKDGDVYAQENKAEEPKPKQAIKPSQVVNVEIKSKTQTKLPHHPNTKYARAYQLGFGFCLQLDGVMEEVEDKEPMVLKFKSMMEK